MPRRRSGAMHVVKTIRRRNGREYCSWLLRTSVREGARVRKHTLANLSHLPEPIIAVIRRMLAGEAVVPAQEALVIQHSRPHGHVAAVLGLVRQLGLEALLGPARGPRRRARDLVVGLLVSRVVAPASKLATLQWWGTTSLPELLGLTDAGEDELYAALDWLLVRQPAVERVLARRHLADGALVLYDVTSTYVEGRHCGLAARGYSRDHRPDREQIVFGLVLDAEGRPLAVEAFAGNTADPATVERQVEKLQQQFGLERVVLVGDRGMLTQARIERVKELGGVGWISSLRAPAIRGLVEGGAIQLSLFDEQHLAEITAPAYPGERLVVCKNPLLAAERARKREDLLRSTEAALGQVAAQVASGRLKDPARIGLRVGQVLNRWKVGKHFRVRIGEGELEVARDQAAIAAEAALDGLYVVRTSVGQEQLSETGVVSAYKSLSHAERAFRCLKSVDLEVRPIYHYKDDRVRAHLFLCLLAAYVQWHLRQAWAPLLFQDEAPPLRVDPVLPAERSAAARRKEQRKRTEDGLPVQRLRVLLDEMAAMTNNWVVPRGLGEQAGFDQRSQPTPLQARAFELLGLNPAAM